MEKYFSILQLTHIVFGSIGFVCGYLALFSKKGSYLHKKSGNIFVFSMVFSVLISILITLIPKHENQFLVLIGCFTIYFVFSGLRALQFKKTPVSLLDKFMSCSLFCVGVFMCIQALVWVITIQKLSVLYLFFGVGCLLISWADYRFYKQSKRYFLSQHISRMMGGLIAATTAFIVAGLNLSQLVFWILPSLIGTYFIRYNIKKYSTPNTTTKWPHLILFPKK